MQGLCLFSSQMDVFWRLRTSSEDFGVLQEYSEMTVSFFKNPSTPRIKSHAYISEKVGRHRLQQHPPPLRHYKYYYSPLFLGGGGEQGVTSNINDHWNNQTNFWWRKCHMHACIYSNLQNFKPDNNFNWFPIITVPLCLVQNNYSLFSS